MAQIIDMICDGLGAYLKAHLEDNVSNADPTKAVLVRVGRLQASPVTNYIHILVDAGDPDKPEDWIHEVWKDNQNLNSGSVGPYEIGGEMLFWRRFTIQVGCFFITQGYNRDTAREYAHRVLGRLEYYLIRNQSVLGVVDEFGERALAIYLMKSRFTEGGGPPQQFVWRGKIHFEILTSRSLG